MSFMSDEMLSQMRGDVAMMLPDTCVIQSKTETVDSGGSRRVVWSASGTVACRLDPISTGTRGMIADIAGRESLENLRQLTIPYDSTIAHGYQVIINSRTYQVIDLIDEHSWKVSVRAVVERVS